MARTNTSTLTTLAATLFGVAAILAAGNASAQECASDTDCSSGFTCVKGWSSGGCSDPTLCPTPTPVQDPTGWCERAPITCTTDTDCPSFLRCVANQNGTCWVDSNGNTGCDPVDPNAPKTCEYVALTCIANADCPVAFECVSMPVGCPTPDCMPGTDCPIPECLASPNQCIPQTISCQADADCPSSWMCQDFSPDCTTPTEPPPAAVDGGVAPNPTPAPIPAPDCTNAPVIKQCVPPGFGGGASYGSATTAPEAAADRAGNTATPTASEIKDGPGIQCAMSHETSGKNLWIAAIGAMAAAVFTARRMRRQ